MTFQPHSPCLNSSHSLVSQNQQWAICHEIWVHTSYYAATPLQHLCCAAVCCKPPDAPGPSYITGKWLPTRLMIYHTPTMKQSYITKCTSTNSVGIPGDPRRLPRIVLGSFQHKDHIFTFQVYGEMMDNPLNGLGLRENAKSYHTLLP